MRRSDQRALKRLKGVLLRSLVVAGNGIWDLGLAQVGRRLGECYRDRGGGRGGGRSDQGLVSDERRELTHEIPAP